MRRCNLQSLKRILHHHVLKGSFGEEAFVFCSEWRTKREMQPHFQVHFGVNSGATKFAVEQQAVNEATFLCPDELGWKPQKEPIIRADGEISRIRETSLPVNEISEVLSKKGFDVMVSDDAGKFVCNYVYYHSLHFAEQNGTKSLFVHVPLFSTINEEIQMQVAATLLDILVSLC